MKSSETRLPLRRSAEAGSAIPGPRPQFIAVHLLALALLSSCASNPQPAADLKRFEYQQPQMGLPFRIVLYAPDATSADAAAGAAFQRISQLNDILSDYDTDSELSHLSRTSGEGKVVPLSDDLWFVLERAQSLAERSDGAFDITVGPCVNLWRKARRERKLPDSEWLANARKATGYQHLRLDRRKRTAELLVPDMRLDLGGIAKGYAIDEALKVLRRHGVHRALVSGGGDLAVGEPPPGKKGWRIELAPLDVTNAPPAKFVLLTNRALATSGDLFQRLEIDGKRYSHIVDPRTGIGLTDHSLVSVIARDCITADSLTKVASVLEPARGMRLVEDTGDAVARIVRKPDEQIEVRESRGFRRFYERE